MIRGFYLALGAYLVLLTAGRGEVIVGQGQPMIMTRGANEQLIQYVTAHIAEGAGITYQTNSYIELRTGLNRWSEETQEWVAASPVIETVNGYGVVRNAQYRAIISGNANAADGLLDMYSPYGDRLTTQTVGLALTDETGKSVFLAELKDSEGVLVDDQTVVFSDAFDQFAASIVIRVTLAGLESDVVLEERIDRGLVREFGLDPDTTNVEVWHQVLNKPEITREPRKVKRVEGGEDRDETLHFRGMAIASGTAFLTAWAENRRNLDAVAVAKEWSSVGGVDFLIERVPFREAEQEFSDLPGPKEARIQDRARVRQMMANRSQSAGRVRPFSVAQYAKLTKPSAVRHLAALTRDTVPTRTGYVIDFPVTLTTQTNLTFRGDSTYWVAGTVNLYGTTVLEGGAVIKSTNYTAANPPIIAIHGDFDCRTSPYNVAVFTAEDDNTVGETISTSSGVPLTASFYAQANLRFETAATAVDVHDLQSRYALKGLSFARSTTHSVWNAQFFNCDYGVEVANAHLNLRNALFTKVRQAVNSLTTVATTNVVVAEQLTVNSAEKLFYPSPTATGLLRITNSILCAVTNDGALNVTSNNTVSVTASAFQPSGRGLHYLAPGSLYRNAGTTNLNANTLAILRKTTTYPPSEIAADFTTDTTLSPIAQRDTDRPDLGYHYYPLDYLLGDRAVTNATLVLTNGVALGLYGTNGLILRNSSKFYSQGRPTALNTIVRYQSVQEDSTSMLSTNFTAMGVLQVTAPSTDPDLQLRFTKVALLANITTKRQFLRGYTGTELVNNYSIRDSEFANTYHDHYAYVTGGGMTIDVFNNSFLRPYLSYYQVVSPSYYTFPLLFRNNLVRGGTVAFNYQATNSAWTVTDNLFDGVTLSGGTYSFTASNNGYRSTTSLGGSGNKTLTTLDFVTGPLGGFYYPTSGTNLAVLIDAGSRNATNAGLYHFTTTSAANTKETTSVVDIGFHYVGTDTASQPIDTDMDGTADWFEDKNGNGNGADDPTSWQTYNSPSGLASAADLRIFTPLKP